GIDRGPGAMLIYRVAGTSPQDGDYFREIRPIRCRHHRCLVCGVSQNTKARPGSPRQSVPVRLTEAPFARASSRVAVDQTGDGAFLNLARLPSAIGSVIQSVVEQKQNTIAAAPAADAILQGLNPAQQRAVAFGIGENNGAAPPLLIAAGAGTGKTKTLAHRVARLILVGVDPRRLLLLTFTRRAALEMTRRTQQILAASRGAVTFGVEAELLPWSGTFHSIGNRLLRQYAASLA